MKKYRCLWCLSRINHNILYFIHIPSIRLLNPAICLWKALNRLVQRGFGWPILL